MTVVGWHELVVGTQFTLNLFSPATPKHSKPVALVHPDLGLRHAGSTHKQQEHH